MRNGDFASSSSSYIEKTADSQDNCITGTANNTQLANLLNYKINRIRELRNGDFASSSSSYIERTADSQDDCITGTANNTQLANLLIYKKTATSRNCGIMIMNAKEYLS